MYTNWLFQKQLFFYQKTVRLRVIELHSLEKAYVVDRDSNLSQMLLNLSIYSICTCRCDLALALSVL